MKIENQNVYVVSNVPGVDPEDHEYYSSFFEYQEKLLSDSKSEKDLVYDLGVFASRRFDERTFMDVDFWDEDRVATVQLFAPSQCDYIVNFSECEFGYIVSFFSGEENDLQFVFLFKGVEAWFHIVILAAFNDILAEFNSNGYVSVDDVTYLRPNNEIFVKHLISCLEKIMSDEG